MRFRTRAFLCCFIPFALLLAGSFWMVQNLVQSTVREGVRKSLLERHQEVALALAKSDLQNSRFLKVVGENAALKAGVQLLLSYPHDPQAQRTVEDQLSELCGRMGFALLMVTSPDGIPLAGALSSGGIVRPFEGTNLFEGINLKASRTGLVMLDGLTYQLATWSLDQGDENIGSLSVGEIFDFSGLTGPTVLLHDGHVLKSNIPDIGLPELDAAVSHCLNAAECDVRLRGVNYISEPLQHVSLGDGYILRSLQNLDAAVGPVQTLLKNAFGSVALGAVLIALIVSIVSADSIVQPIATVVAHLQQAEKTGGLMEFRSGISGVMEIRRLIESFNRAAGAIREGRENLTLAYVEFVQSLASALDARDPYTAGHSHRVSEMSRAIARAMQLSPDIVERVRVGALLHDIGKIGIADSLLRKPGRLTAEEFAIISEHPVIGRRILEGVHGFSPYLAAVELHHENWDGTGYPHGQAGEETPIDARVIHVTDAYDAMTTDRPYRAAMTHDEAMTTLQANAGTMFDPEVVRWFASVKTGEPAFLARQSALSGGRS